MSQGSLEVITGPMYAGKTSELLERRESAKIAGKKVKSFKPVVDDRFLEGSKIVTHNDESVQAITVKSGYQITEHVTKDTDVVIVDEVNLFSQGFVPNMQSLANGGHRVILAGTDQTFRGNPFTPLGRLMVVADRVDKLQAVCKKCGDEASMNQRFNVEGEPAHIDDPLIRIGGEETYEARCRDCHEVRGVDQ
jgi:Thymidine kinase